MRSCKLGLSLLFLSTGCLFAMDSKKKKGTPPVSTATQEYAFQINRENAAALKASLDQLKTTKKKGKNLILADAIEKFGEMILLAFDRSWGREISFLHTVKETQSSLSELFSLTSKSHELFQQVTENSSMVCDKTPDGLLIARDEFNKLTKGFNEISQQLVAQALVTQKLLAEAKTGLKGSGVKIKGSGVKLIGK